MDTQTSSILERISEDQENIELKPGNIAKYVPDKKIIESSQTLK
jgi:hypothetical protein